MGPAGGSDAAVSAPNEPVRIKFCGFTREVDIDAALELQVDFIGLIFVPQSPRCLTLDQAVRLRRRIPASTKAVALTMDQPRDAVAAIIDAIGPDVLQFHGAETDDFCAGFGLPFFKTIAMGGSPSSDEVLARCAALPSAYAWLFDGHAAGEQGGSGQRFDWASLAGIGAQKPFFLAGGLDPGNVALAIRTASPWGVDLSSGIESAPGVKDCEKMRAFVQAVRGIDAALPSSP